VRILGVIGLAAVFVLIALYLIWITLPEVPGAAEPEGRPRKEGEARPAESQPATEEARLEPLPIPRIVVKPETGRQMAQQGEDGSSGAEAGGDLDAWSENWSRKCVSLVREKRLDDALVCLNLLLAQNPEDAEAHLNLGIAHAMKGDRIEAYYQYQKYLELDPDGTRARIVEKILDQYDRYNSSPPPEESDKPVVQRETLTKGEIYAEMKKYLRAMKGCVLQQKQRDPSVTGTLLTSFTINPNGRTSDVQILTEEHRGKYVAGCISYLLKNMKFPRFNGEPIRVPRLPLKLGD